MNKIYKHGLFMLAAGALAVSCADYNVTDNFTPEGTTPTEYPYSEYDAINSYIDKSKYPNMTINTGLTSKEFKAQELEHAAAVTNFDGVTFGADFMSGKFMRANGVQDFTDMQDILEHTEELGFNVFGSPIAANNNQADEWISRLTAPITIFVEYVEGDKVDYTKMDKFNGTTVSGTAGTIEKKQGVNALKIANRAKVNIIEGFDVDPLAKYTITFNAWTDAAGGQAQFNLNFCGKSIEGIGTGGIWTFGAGGWRTVVVEGVRCPEDATAGYLTLENTRSGIIWISDVEMGFFPDDHRAQTEEEVNDTINYALNTWCNALMRYNAGRIKSFDLIEEAISASSKLDNGMLDLKHSTDKIYWQDIFGSENYGPKVYKAAAAAYEKNGGNPSELKFFVSESTLENETKMESLNYWIGVWEAGGAKIDGITAKLGNLAYYVDAEKFAANKAAFDKMLDKLAATGKLIRLTNFDIKYIGEDGKAINADKLTDEERQCVADYYAYAIRSYLTKIRADKQAGIYKGCLVDKSENVGLWASRKVGKTTDWVRTSVYKAFCEALSGK